MNTLIQPDQDLLIFFVLLSVSLFGIYGERRGWFRKISGVLVTLVIMSLLATANVVPSPSVPGVEVDLYDIVFDYFVPISIPLLLFKVQLKRVVQESGRLLLAFCIGAVGVALGAVIAFLILNAGDEAYKLAGVLIGTYTGGSVNFMAVASALDFLDSPLFPATVAVDNVFTNFYIMFMFLMPAIAWVNKRFPAYDDSRYAKPAVSIPTSVPLKADLYSVTVCMTVAVGVFAVARLLAPALASILNTDINLEIFVLTILIIALANVFSTTMAKLSDVAFDLGMFFLYIFLAVIGAASDMKLMLTSAPVILAFAAIILIVHFWFILVVGRLFKLSLEEITVASCANAGGPSTVAPLAASLGMRQAVTPGILVAILGYVIGTFLGASVGLLLQ